ncbi:hypothetical protein [Clostridium cochlearium]|uniref:Uncharacterized protein n=1 Tax=Clostridium cochlearium TaxID=1494 RepID=A0A240B057_CLOCO|nr:hypothetical protein [Clostridium cochlearium]MCG4572252.1 hypothetical protein [Clostridium cochlearium]SNV88784.1 Uncharacterised protein [Clostridium cochlearium]SQB36053.1 Uncharacterised protein [Clostridium cochlearium]STA93721.1 Uncharacterised protein [Clostridium cochlearium]
MKINKRIKYIALFTLLIFSISVPIFTLIYFNKNSHLLQYNKSIRTNINNINKVNKEVSSYTTNNIFNASKYRYNLPNSIKLLNSSKTNLEKYKPNEKYKDIHLNLIKGITNNIYTYEQLLAILNSPESQDVDKAFYSFKKYRDDSIKFYELFNSSNPKLKINLSKDFLDCLNISTEYIQELVNLQKDKDIKMSQYKDYFYNVDYILTSFLEVRKDFSYYKDKIQNRTVSVDELLNEIALNKKELQELKLSMSKISIPSDGINCYILLSKTLNDYASYIHSFEDDISKSVIANDSKSTNIYSKSDLGYKIMNDTYNEFIKYYSNFKDTVK